MRNFAELILSKVTRSFGHAILNGLPYEVKSGETKNVTIINGDGKSAVDVELRDFGSRVGGGFAIRVGTGPGAALVGYVERGSRLIHYEGIDPSGRRTLINGEMSHSGDR